MHLKKLFQFSGQLWSSCQKQIGVCPSRGWELYLRNKKMTCNIRAWQRGCYFSWDMWLNCCEKHLFMVISLDPSTTWMLSNHSPLGFLLKLAYTYARTIASGPVKNTVFPTMPWKVSPGRSLLRAVCLVTARNILLNICCVLHPINTQTAYKQWNIETPCSLLFPIYEVSMK